MCPVEVDEDGRKQWEALVAAIKRALAERPPCAAQLTIDNDDLSLVVTPRNPEAAAMEVHFDGATEISFEVGVTDTNMWQYDETPLEEHLYRVAAGVMGGTLKEFGSFNATGRVQSTGGWIEFGNAPRLPWSWKWRRVHRHAPYT